MVFSTPIFLFYFLVLTMLVYYLFSLLGVIYEVIMIFLILRPFNLAV